MAMPNMDVRYPMVEEDLKTYEDVKENLEAKGSLGYDPSVKCLTSAYHHLSSEHTLSFLKCCFARIANILLEQNPGKTGQFERKRIEESLELSILIISELMKTDPASFFDVLVHLLSKSVPYYAGTKTYWTKLPGDPHVRLQLIRTFHEHDGFQLLREYLNKPGTVWPGAEKMHIIIRALSDIDTEYADPVSKELIGDIMSQLLSLPEEITKKESVDALANLIKAMVPRSEHLDEKFQSFWLKYTLKLMNAGSIVLKLFAWDQVQEIVKEAMSTRPPAARYLVRGAGIEEINGIYVGDFDDDGGAPVYRKYPDEPGGKLYSLLQCVMRTKQKWWFISIADPDRPGTDKDVDFYQHKSTPEQEHEPSRLNWNSVVPPGRGVDPPPVLIRLEARPTPTEPLINTVFEWVAENKLLDHVFGQSIHREIISRSKPLLVAMCDEGRLTPTQIIKIWKVALSNTAEEIQEELFSLFANIAPYMSDDMFAVLMDLAQEAVTKDTNGDNIHKISLLLDHIRRDGVKFIRILTPSSESRLLSLVWSVYSHQYCDGQRANIEELLLNCLRCAPSSTVEQYITECSLQLSHVREHDEKKITGVINNLNFLLSTHLINNLVLEDNFFVTMHEEIKRFVESQRSATTDESWYLDQLFKRLSILRNAHGLSTHAKMTVNDLDHLWELLPEPNERGKLFEFLRSAGQRLTNLQLDSAIDINECYYVFTRLICSDDVDWSTCDEEAFMCFQTYFNGLTKRKDEPRSLEIKSQGLDTLWKITLSIPAEPAAASATHYLMKLYDDYTLYDPSYFSDFFKRIFARLESARLSIMDSGRVDAGVHTAMSRCIELLLGSILKSKLSEPAHCVRGCIFRIRIVVKYRDSPLVTHYPMSTYTSRPLEKPADKYFTLDIHPMHTLATVKSKLAKIAGISSSRRIVLEHGDVALSGDHIPISQFGISDGSELTGSLYSSVSTVFDDDDVSDLYFHQKVDISRTVFNPLASREHFDCLVDLFETLDKHDCTDVASSIWRLINMTPTQSDILNDVLIALKTSPTLPEDWILDQWAASRLRTTYVLQIVDSVLQPAPECEDLYDIDIPIDHFLVIGGFTFVLKFIKECPRSSLGKDKISTMALSLAVHILHFCMFGGIAEDPSANLLLQVQESASEVLEKLLLIAHSAAEADETGVVQDALMMISCLLQSPQTANQLTSNPHCRSLLTAVLRSSSKKVREMAADFAVQIGKIQPIVITWLREELDVMSLGDRNCYDIFRALTTLVHNMTPEDSALRKDIKYIVASVSRMLMSFASNNSRLDDSSMLLGCLQLLNQLIEKDVIEVTRTQLGESLVGYFVSDFLFTMPSTGVDRAPICDTPDTRRAAYNVLQSYVRVSHTGFMEVLDALRDLYSHASSHMKHSWGLQVSHDVKRSKMEFTGLKNQGCTCYLNSLTQQLFMSEKIREAVLSTPICNLHRTTLWHMNNEEIVGKRFFFEWVGNNWRFGTIIAFDPVTGFHRVHYEESDEGPSEEVSFNVREGRFHKETGRVKWALENPDDFLTDQEDSALRVLEQLQRTFCFMKYSKKRYFDPKPFVEVCKTLNLNFNVYHQNDASEFCDQLLDRLETAMKGQFTGVDMWSTVMQRSVFGGKVLYQKIPKECTSYEDDKNLCGHWRSTRSEDFLKIELIIRGKEKIEDSLLQLIQGELMDGDNKIMCDTCNEKKDTIRRTCLGNLPNVLMLHLKRFDLDFTTFETVKLNNRIAFPMKLNMLRYTKEGIEMAEMTEEDEGDEKTKEIAAALNLDPSDYEYELQGVLVHSGVAQGGHYYSFIQDMKTSSWYRFEDEDVSSFNPDHIAAQCFGGTVMSSFQGVSNMIEEDRSANALMLFYNKIKPRDLPDEDVTERTMESTDTPTTVTPASTHPKTTGLEAFHAEVAQSNFRHMVTSYLLDSDLHDFVKSLVRVSHDNLLGTDNCGKQWDLATVPLKLGQVTVQFALQFYLDIVLHCRERLASKSWVNLFKNSFESHPEVALWFLQQLMITSTYTWLRGYLFQCNDALARNSFIQLVVAAVHILLPKDHEVLQHYFALSKEQLVNNLYQKHETSTSSLVLFVRMIIVLLPEACIYLRTCDELFVLLKELAMIPAICDYFLSKDVVAHLSYFIMPDKVPEKVKDVFLSHHSTALTPTECAPLLQVVFETIATLLGAPQIAPVNLLKEKATAWEPELTFEATEALTTVFTECSHAGGMDMRCMSAYMEKVQVGYNMTAKALNSQIRSVLDRYDTTPDDRLTLHGFLRYHADNAQYTPKTVWKTLRAFGFQNDLTRVINADVSAASLTPLHVPENTRVCLLEIGLFEIGLDSCEAATIAIAQRICTHDAVASKLLIDQACSRLLKVVRDWAWNPMIDVIVGFLRMLVKLEDGLMECRLRELFLGESGFLTIINLERSGQLNPRRSVHPSYASPALSPRYLEFIQSIASLPLVYEWIETASGNDANLQWILTQLTPLSQPLSQPLSPPDANDYSFMDGEVSLSVQGAGVPEVNGVYHLVETSGGAGIFRKRGKYANSPVEYSLYRCVNSHGCRWYISIIAANREPGTADDIDFYMSDTIVADCVPPTAQWVPCQGSHTCKPGPTVSCITDYNDDSDDQEDSLAVVDDEDRFNSLPGTPGAEFNDTSF